MWGSPVGVIEIGLWTIPLNLLSEDLTSVAFTQCWNVAELHLVNEVLRSWESAYLLWKYEYKDPSTAV